MDFARFSKEKISKFRKKLIPWHCQKRYQGSLNEFSMNHSVLSALYKQKIKSLQKNNKFLALALQHHRSLITEKDNLIVENGKSMDIINFSRLKLMDMVEQMKKATACLEETLLLLNLGISDNLSRNAQNNVNYRTEFKNKLQEINIDPIEEVTEQISESSNSSEEQETSLNKSNNSKKNRSLKRKRNHVTKTSKAFCARDSNSSLENNSNKGSILNSKPSPKISNIHCNTKSISNKSSKNEACAVLNEICETSNRKKTDPIVKYNEPMTSNPIKKQWKNIVNLQKASERGTHSKKKTINKKINEVESLFLSKSNFSCDKLPNSINETQQCTVNTNSNPCINLNSQLCSNPIIVTDENKPEVSVQNKNAELMCDKINDIVDVNKVEKNISNSGNKCREAFVEIENNMECNEVRNSRCKKRVCFYFDEEAIETVKSKNISKVKNNSAKRKRALQTITEISNCNNKLNIKDNTFVVTAEIHPVPDDVCKENSNKKIDTLNLQPSVVLTDIFKSNKAMISDTINEGPLENNYLKKMPCEKSTEARMDVKENGPNVIYLNSEMEKTLPMESLLERKDCRRRARVVSYKEPPLHLKMRRYI